MPLHLGADVGQWPTSPAGEPQDAPGGLCTNLLGTLYMSKMGIIKASLSFNCFLLFLDPATWRLAALGISCARWWHQCFVPTCLAAAGENAKMPETNDYLVVCLHTGLQLMCSMMYLTALVWLWCLHYKQECLTAQLM